MKDRRTLPPPNPRTPKEHRELCGVVEHCQPGSHYQQGDFGHSVRCQFKTPGNLLGDKTRGVC